MSQKKVEEYKEYKKNKKDILKKEKMMKRLEIAIALIVAAVVVGWVIWSVAFKAKSSDTTVEAEAVTYFNVDDFETYYESLPLDYSTLNNQTNEDSAE